MCHIVFFNYYARKLLKKSFGAAPNSILTLLPYTSGMTYYKQFYTYCDVSPSHYFRRLLLVYRNMQLFHLKNEFELKGS